MAFKTFPNSKQAKHIISLKNIFQTRISSIVDHQENIKRLFLVIGQRNEWLLF